MDDVYLLFAALRLWLKLYAVRVADAWVWVLIWLWFVGFVWMWFLLGLSSSGAFPEGAQ